MTNPSEDPHVRLVLQIKERVEKRRWEQYEQEQKFELDRELGRVAGRALKSSLPDVSAEEATEAILYLRVVECASESLSDAYIEGVVEAVSD